MAEKKGIMLAVDISGSMYDCGAFEVAKTLAESKDVKQVVTFNSEIVDEHADLTKPLPPSREGTDFKCITDYFRKSSYEYLVIYTDGYADKAGCQDISNKILLLLPISN